jgi:hypothetical protein
MTIPRRTRRLDTQYNMMIEDRGRRHAMIVLITSRTARTWASEYSERAPFSARSSAGFLKKDNQYMALLNEINTGEVSCLKMPPDKAMEERENP